VLAGLAAAAAAALLAIAVHALAPGAPALTVALLLGVLCGNIPGLRRLSDGPLRQGFALSARRVLRIGIVLLGLKVSLVDVAGLGWPSLLAGVFIVASAFVVTWTLARLARLPGQQPLLLAAGFSICGVSAIGAFGSATKARNEDTAVPIALVTIFGTLAIVVLPALSALLGLGAESFGAWVGLSVQDVGQVVATAQISGSVALATATVVKLTRVLALAPMVALVGIVQRRREGMPLDDATRRSRPPIVPLFIAGFLLAVLVRTWVPLPAVVFDVADQAQTLALGMALFALGTGIRGAMLRRAGIRAIAVGAGAWAYIALVALLAVVLVQQV